MEEFRFLYTTKFRDKRFCVLSNENYRVYILEILEGGQLCYPQYEDYICFYKKFQEFTEGKISLEIKRKSGSTEDSADIKNILQPDKKRHFFKFNPKVIRNGVLISAIMAMFLAGCAFPGSSSASFEKTTEEERIEQRIDLASEADFEIEYMPELKKYITRSYVDSEDQAKVIICTTNEQMKPYFPDKNQNPTYEDVRNTIRQNENIPEKFKIHYIELLNKMEEEMPEIDLFVLNLNAERMIVKEKKYLGSALGKFYPETGIIEYREDPSEFTTAHEFGHAVLGGEFEIEGDIVIFKTFSLPENRKTYDLEEGKDFFYTTLHGSMIGEYVADKFGEMLTGENNDKTRPYAPTDYHIEMFRSACNYSLQDLINEGSIGFARAMLENDIDYPVSFMDDEDHLISRYNILDYDEEFPKYGVTIASVPLDFFLDWAEEKFEREEEGIEERAIEIITGTTFTDGVCYMYAGEEQRVVDSLTPEELTVIVKEGLWQLDRTKTTSIQDFIEDIQGR